MVAIFDYLERSFRWADVADIGLVALLLYTFLLWFKSTASRQILIGVGILFAVYGFARAFDLYMTTYLFQAVLAFSAIAAIVVFQEDIRRGFIRIASLGSMRQGHPQTLEKQVDILVEAAFDFARRRIGALIIAQGSESLGRHLRGGVAADARISKAILDSIFDPHSMGHDGAVIIDGDRISHFAVRLPLSENSEEIGAKGTRHSAALGLSERSDAFIIVVSEERGEVSVARSGKFEFVTRPMDLKQRLDHFVHRTHPRSAADLRRRLLIENLGLKVTALLIAIVAWFMVSFEADTIHKTFVVPVEYRKLPETMDISDDAPTQVRVTLTGYERAFSLLAPSTLKVSLDMSRVEEGPQQVVIDESSIKLPSNLTLFRTAPRILTFSVHTWAKGRIPIELRTEGRLPRSLRDRELQIIPDAVRGMVWRSSLTSSTRIYTEPVDLARFADVQEIRAKLVIPEFLRPDSDQPTEARVTLSAPREPDGEPPAPEANR